MRVIRQKLEGVDVVVDRLECGPVRVTCIPDIANIAWPAKAIFGALSSDALAAAEARAPSGTVNASTADASWGPRPET